MRGCVVSVAGVGIDVVDCARFAEGLASPGSAFAARTFTAHEQATAWSRPSGEPAVHLAARYAAKEAFVKALSQCLAPGPLPEGLLDLREVEVVLDAESRPSLALSGHALRLADRAGVTRLHVSLSHDGPIATAIVLAER